MISDSMIETFMRELQSRVSGDVRTDAYSKMLYSTDASMYQVMPHGVLIPKTNEDVHAAVELAAKYKMPILPRNNSMRAVVIAWVAISAAAWSR